jgi:hypothetical protein
MMLRSPRTAKYVDALIREGDNFDFRKWLRRVREEEAQAKQVPKITTSGESEAFEIGNLTDMPDRQDAWVNSDPVVHPKLVLLPRVVFRSVHEDRGEGSRDRLRRQLVTVCDAWDDFQGCRDRDAVYGYLRAVFALVMDHKGRRRTKRLLRRTFQFAGLPLDKNTDPFATVIRCTSERNVDNKTISKWARALRYAAYCKKPRTPLKAFVKKMGGINACAERYAIYLGRGSR